MSAELRISQLVIATGIASVVNQLIIIREFIAQFQGNEFIIALILFNWLLLSGIGTWGAHVASEKFLSRDFRRLSLLVMLLSALSPLTLLAIRLFRDVVFIPGSDVGFYATFIFVFSLLAPYCLLLGFLLPFSLFCAKARIDPAFSGVRIYIADNIGDISGGVLFSFVLVFVATPLQSLFFINTLLLVSAVTAMWPTLIPRCRYLILALIIFLLLLLTASIEKSSLSRPAGKLIHYEESRYGRIEIHQHHQQNTLFLNGWPVFSESNIALAEEAVHYPLSQLEKAGKILLISAEGGMIEEIVKYNPASIDYIEIDPSVTNALFRYDMIPKIPGLNVIHQDGRAFLKQTNKQYDAIIVNLPSPQTFQVNRFFTDTFFSIVKNNLGAKGIFCFHIEPVGNYLSETQRNIISILHRTASEHFSNILVLPGQRVFFLCSDFRLLHNIPELLDNKKIQTDYIYGYYHGNLSDERIKALKDSLIEDVPLNSDYFPRLVGIMFHQWLAKFNNAPILFIILAGFGLMVYLVRSKREEFVLFTSGATAMGSEILVIFAFQIFFGYIYYQIGLIVTVFLLGLVPGAAVGELYRHEGKKLFLLTDGFLIAAFLCFISAVLYMGDHIQVGVMLVFGALVSFACGIQFPIALHLGGHEDPVAVRAFSADLIGAATGTLVTSVVMMPYFGLIWTTAALISLKMISFLLVLAGDD